MNDAHDTRHITTEIATAKPFYYAEDDHQQYLYKTRTAIAASAALAFACRPGVILDFRLNSEAVNVTLWRLYIPYAILASVTAGPAPSDRFLCKFHILSYQLPFEDLASTVGKDMLNIILVILCLIAVSAFFRYRKFHRLGSRKIRTETAGRMKATSTHEAVRRCRRTRAPSLRRADWPQRRRHSWRYCYGRRGFLTGVHSLLSGYLRRSSPRQAELHHLLYPGHQLVHPVCPDLTPETHRYDRARKQ